MNDIDEKFYKEIEDFNLDYLCSLHTELFKNQEGFKDSLGIITDQYKNPKYYEELLSIIRDIQKNIKENLSLLNLKDLLYDLWESQPFYDGNTRTICVLTKIILNQRNILTEDFDKLNISSGYNSIEKMIDDSLEDHIKRS